MKRFAMQFKALWLCTFLLLGLPAMSFAGGSTCAIATAVIPDGRSLELDYAPASSTVWYQFGATANHSYSVEVRDDLDPDNSDFNPPTGNVLLYGAPVNCSSLPTPLVTRDTHSIEPAAGPHAVRVSFVASTTGAHYIYVLNGGSTGHYVTVTVADTTQYSTRWSSWSPAFTFFGFTNTTSSTINLTLTLASPTAATIVAQSYSIPAKQAIYTDTGTLNVTPNLAGYAFYTYDGPPGVIAADTGIEFTNPSGPPSFQPEQFGSVRPH